MKERRVGSKQQRRGGPGGGEGGGGWKNASGEEGWLKEEQAHGTAGR